MNITIITDKKGTITGTMRGHRKDHEKVAEDCASLVLGDEDQCHEVECPDEFARFGAEELHRHLKDHLSK